jgi:hypothetical protein
MRDLPNIDPTDAARRGLVHFDAARNAQTKNIKLMNADAERYAKARGWRIVGRWDGVDVPGSKHSRRYWCQS